MNLGERIKNFRILNRYTKKELANLIKIDTYELTKWEDNEIKPDEKHIKKLSKAFKIDPDFLRMSDEKFNKKYTKDGVTFSDELINNLKSNVYTIKDSVMANPHLRENLTKEDLEKLDEINNIKIKISYLVPIMTILFVITFILQLFRMVKARSIYAVGAIKIIYIQVVFIIIYEIICKIIDPKSLAKGLKNSFYATVLWGILFPPSAVFVNLIFKKIGLVDLDFLKYLVTFLVYMAALSAAYGFTLW